MTKLRPYVLSIAGYDPSGGAGVLADVKTFETIGVTGFAVATCITYQNDERFDGVEWLSKKKIKNQLYPILDAYKIQFVKIGLIKSVVVMSELMELLLSYNKHIRIIWDPVIKSSSGFPFHKKLSRHYLQYILDTVDIITPNWEEIQMLCSEKDPVKAGEQLSQHCHVYLKGGHNIETPATDLLWINKQLRIYHPEEISTLDKHGTGCVLSSAITAYLALGHSMEKSCELAKHYTFRYLVSNPSNLGYHGH